MESYRSSPTLQPSLTMPRAHSRSSVQIKTTMAPDMSKRSKTPPFRDEDSAWQQMLNVHEWIMHQEYQKIRRENQRMRKNGTTGKQYHPNTTQSDGVTASKIRNQKVEDVDMQARVWMRLEEMRRAAAIQEAERSKQRQRELYNQQNQYAQRQRTFGRENRNESLRTQRVIPNERQYHVNLASLWADYQTKWENLTAVKSSENLTFQNIAWPISGQPAVPNDLTLERISTFLLSPSHSHGVSNKERIKEALRRWHPDRFRRWMNKVADQDKARVEEGVGIVARCLNELLAQQTKFLTSASEVN